MDRWIECEDLFIGDVVCWVDGAFEERGPRNAKGKARLVRVGEREVTAEVFGEDRAWIYLRVLDAAVLSDKTKYGRRVHPLKRGEEIRRKRKTIMGRKQAARRRLWTDEAARERVAAEYDPAVLKDPAWKMISER